MAKTQSVIDKAKYDVDYRKLNKTKIQKRMKQYYIDNKKERDNYQKQYYKKNIIHIKQHREQYIENNKGKILGTQLKYETTKYRTNLMYNLNRKISGALGYSIRNNKHKRHWEDLVGYTLRELKQHLLRTMPKNCTWEDFLNGVLHIDHIIPMRTFIFNKSEDKEFKDCWSLDNLRLLTKERNLKKNNNFDNPILLGFLIKEMI